MIRPAQFMDCHWIIVMFEINFYSSQLQNLLIPYFIIGKSHRRTHTLDLSQFSSICLHIYNTSYITDYTSYDAFKSLIEYMTNCINLISRRGKKFKILNDFLLIFLIYKISNRKFFEYFHLKF